MAKRYSFGLVKLNATVKGGNHPSGIFGLYVQSVTNGHQSKSVKSVYETNYVNDTGNVTVRRSFSQSSPDMVPS